MSYSYIKSVYPNFENSSRVYEETKIYEEPLFLDKTSDNNKSEVNPSNYEEKLNKFTKSLLHEDSQNKSILQKYKNQQNDKNNLKYYNLQAPNEFYKWQNKHLMENFDEEKPVCKDLDCDIMMKHINECTKCKNVFLKQFGLENDKIRNEELMELISYLIFGLFMLMLLDTIKNQK